MFRTELPLVPAPQQLPLSARVLTIGSCFSDTIGTRLAEAKVHASVNPFGTVFNPISACKLLRAAAGEDTDWQQHLVEARGRWQSYDLHATLGADSPVDLLQTLQQQLRDTGVFLATADTVILTLGSAWAYRLKETDELVSNCHKMPGEKFNKELLTPDEIINAVAETHAYLRLRNPKLQFVLTVSPVRHIKDTLPLNAVSKSVLRVACHYLSELLPDVSYFPAYELLLDDLRDYRFYAADMLHPSSVAEDYIWERFARTYFDADFGRFRKEWDLVRQALNHRPLYEAAPEHRQFLTGTLERLEKLAGRADMRMEILEVRKRLENLPAPKPVAAPTLDAEDDEERIDIGDAATAPEVAIPANVPLATAPDLSPELDETGENEAEALAETMTETGLPKKKRRSRGGAKRNKKKHAARLAEEVETAAATDTITNESAESLAAEGHNEASVTVVFDPEAPLQTAMERRKRASRRNRGRNKQQGEVAIDNTASVAEASLPIPETSETTNETTDLPTADTDATTGYAPATTGAAETINEDATSESGEPVAATTGIQRPLRTGRSASEVRAAALRKPRRPDSRIKALYATPPAPAESEALSCEIEPEHSDAATPVSVPTPTDTGTSVNTTSDTPAAIPTVPVAPVAMPRPPVSSAIPPVRGTGASGRLSAAGRATVSAGNAEPANQATPLDAPQPEEISAVPSPEASSIEEIRQPEAPIVSVPDSPVADTEPVASSTDGSASVIIDELSPVIPPIAAAPKKRKATPASSKAKPKTVTKPTPAKAKPKAKKEASKPDAAAATTETPAPDETAAPTAAPVTRRRKAAAKSAAAPELPIEKPKRAPRPSRRKPAAPDETADVS